MAGKSYDELLSEYRESIPEMDPEEVEKILGDAATREMVVQICKDVIIKLYRELSFSYRPVIQRLKV